mmetsp:Transcript_13760/g.20888  ORF Transcript_13760/g.20888 Transcript_13760/m.20888 type:complete len:480 (-) Transcript_13760:141-1580(-)|eukprot:CAMPEP_0203673780 /NCGR_PEP_ID=MMETSP0090-20130426/13794_1 /ASSEMBLY_ACC=CAM_ASM_001088 /TAXON_ID=426623 /ORGANISM="Chaetoceros affinis, Strain CCMP159" /LENGTH=479 /DNA_ID=CAMNT_0050539501 /DNA_START=51 /DNA_END=1490 /DNA_ORIENTATION=-
MDKGKDKDKDQLLVQTPYGRGLVEKTRSENLPTIKEIRLLDWEYGSISSSNNRKSSPRKVSMLYTTIDYPSMTVRKGDQVLTPYGRGVVEEVIYVKIRRKKSEDSSSDNDASTGIEEEILFKYRVLISSWRLAGRSRVRCYLFSSQVKVVRCKTLAEMDAMERVDFATKQKDHAKKFFAEKKYLDALILYAEAVDAVRYIRHTSNNSNECRADLLAIIVTCSNNAATCCIQLERFQEASRYAKDALLLLNALYGKRGMKIHGILLKDNKLSDPKLFGEWRGKSCLIMARSEAQKQLYEEALSNLRAAKDFITVYINNEKSPEQRRLREILKEISKIRNNIVEKKKAILEKEKKRAKAMFTNNVRKTPESNATSTVLKNSDAVEMEKVTTSAREPASHASTTSSAASTVQKSSSESSPTSKNKKGAKKVSFADKLEERHIVEIHKESEEEPWYEEHKEALLLIAIGGLAFATTILGVRKR